MNKSEIQQLIEDAIDENPSLFLIEWSISTNNKIVVSVDGDQGVSIEEIVRISRHVEHNLDREKEDFELTVSSYGLDKPLVTPRQFIKNIGRKLKLKLDDAEVKGLATAADDHGVTLQWSVKEPKPIGKGKHTVEKTETFTFDKIEKANIQIEI